MSKRVMTRNLFWFLTFFVAMGFWVGCEDSVNLGEIQPEAWLGQDWDDDGQVEVLPEDSSAQADYLLDFGKVVLRQRATRIVMLANDVSARGSLKWDEDGIAIVEGSSGNFYLELPPVRELEPGTSTFLTVHYIPMDEGSEEGSISIRTNDPDRSEMILRLMGEGVTPDVQVCLVDTGSGVELCNDTVAPSNLGVDFGMNDLGEVSQRQFLVRNLGVFELTVAAGAGQAGVDFSTGASSEFELSPEPWTGVLLPGEERSFTIAYSPYDGGADQTRIEVTSNDPDDDESVVFIELLGNGLAPKICPVPPFSVDFGSVQIGSIVERSYSFSSCGNEVLNITDLVLDPGVDGYFSFVSNVNAPFDISPGETFELQLRYSPDAEGVHSGRVTIHSNDPNASEGWIDLVGRATPIPMCGLQVQPSQINFGQVPTTGFANQTLALTNTGDADCSVTEFSGPTGSPEFSLPNLPALPIVIPPGEMRTISVRYEPVDEGQDQASFLVLSNNPGDPIEITLLGEGIEPPPCDFRADPSMLNFGTTPMGQARDLSTRIWNFGSEECMIWGWELMAGSDPSYSFSAVPFPWPDVPSGGFIDITVTLNPQSAGLLTGVLEVRGGDSPLDLQRIQVQLSGGGEAARMCLHPEVLDFGPVTVGDVFTQSFDITACGAGNLRIRQIGMDGDNPDFTFASVPGAPRTIPAGQTHTVQVQYSPSEPGADFGRVLVSSNDDQIPVGVIELVGNYTGSCPAVFDCQPSALSFTSTEMGRSRDKSFTCTNHGGESLTVTQVALDAGTSPEFHVASPGLPLVVDPGESLLVEVGYMPSDVGFDNGAVVVSSSFTSAGCDNFTLISVPLDGEGIAPDLPPCIGAQYFTPEEIFKWPTGTVSEPRFNQVFMTPIVVNLTDDNNDGFINEQDVPDIVFNSFAGGISVTEPAILRAISGDDGHEIWSVTDPRFRTNFETQVAAGDIDGDNLPEILVSKLVVTDSGDMTGKFVTGNILCFEHDGTFKWESEAWHAPAEDIEDSSAIGIADLDHDGEPEIFRGPAVFDRHGTLKWEGTAGRGSQAHGAVCTAADLDMQGSMELLCGNTAYRSDGTILWQANAGDGYGAVADFDLDGLPEVILFASGLNGGVKLLDGATGAELSSLPFNSGVNSILYPVIADLDGSGGPEIGAVGTCTVSEEEGECFWGIDVNENGFAMTVLWEELLNDQTLGGGVSAFDFEGDGVFEMMQNDENYINIYRGLEHELIYSAERWSVTGWENPLVVDVNNDGHAEIVVIENGLGMSSGIIVYGNAGADKWVATKRIWNQYDYRITNVRENGTIPRFEVPHWTLYNSVLANEPFCE
ncbi:MAG: choice-of-anchor D domain-containing protein [Deltaproteobacteria bacterium]|nr:choice-of-anchor D domain-containing protein [Deltaproteobacteria bacterium]